MKYLLIAFSCFLFSSTYSQKNYYFLDATIIKKSGDSIICLIKNQINFDDFITYKVTKEAYESQIAITEVSCVKFSFKYLENIKLYNKEIIATLVVDGKVKLYSYVFLEVGETQDVPNSEGGKFTPHRTVIHYFVKKSDVTNEIRSKFFEYDLTPFIKDCRDLLLKLENHDFFYEDMTKIIQDYNNCSN